MGLHESFKANLALSSYWSAKPSARTFYLH